MSGTRSTGTAALSRAAYVGAIVFSSLALLTVLSAVVPIALTGRFPPPAADEGVPARIFQLAIVALFFSGLVFLAAADWSRPLRTARQLVYPLAATALAFSLLYWFEHASR